METQFVALLAQAQAPASGGNDMMRFIWFILIVGFALYFIVLRPQRREQKEREQLISGMAKGDKVVSAGGIHGTVYSLPDKETAEVEVSKGVRMTFNRTSISVVKSLKKKADESKDAKDAKDAKEKKDAKK